MDLFKHFGFFMLYNMTNITNITADLIMEPPEYNVTDFDNIIMSSLWILSACSCGSVISKYKNKKDIPFEIYKNEYEEKYKLYIVDNNNLKENLEKMQKDINELKKIIDKQKKEYDKEVVEEHKDNNNINDAIEDDIIYKYGKGQIRYEIDDKYYHGVGINETQKWNLYNKYDKCFFQYIDGPFCKNEKWDTYNSNDFCKSCIIDEGLSKRRKFFKVYRCLGHVV